MNSLGARLKHARQLRNVTQEKLSDISQVKQGTISKIERGDQEATSFILELANALRVNPLWLKQGEGPMEGGESAAVSESFGSYHIPPEVTSAVDALKRLDTEEIEIVLDIVKLIEQLKARYRD